jgi:quinoprotein glucose dehydrogenase
MNYKGPGAEFVQHRKNLQIPNGLLLFITSSIPSFMKKRARIVGAAVFLIIISMQLGCSKPKPFERKTWHEYGGSPDNSHFLTLNQITKANVNQLKVAWTYPTHDDLSYVFNPTVVDGVMYVLARNYSLVALDAVTGAEKWIHSDLGSISARGIAFWESKDHTDKRLIFTLHQQLQEIDANTGKSILSFGNQGYVDLRAGLNRDPQFIYRIQSGTPGKVFEDLIILGSATGEAYMSPPGDLRAYNVLTGKLVWQFHTVPHPGEFGYDTWPKDAWKYIGGVNTWGEISIDEQRGIAYFPVGSPTYDYYGADRLGTNLFSDCILALDARTGKYLWHYQEVHHDLWDYDPTSAPQLISITVNGKHIDAIAHAGKTGFLYVLDRVTGKPIWPIEERPVPKTEMPGDESSPTQPQPSTPPPFSRMAYGVKDVNPYILTPAERAKVVKQVQDARNQGLFTPPGFYDSIEMPGSRGGSNWGMTASNPLTGTLYVASINAPAILHLEKAEPENLGFGVVRKGGPPGGQIYQQYCQICHGSNLEGKQGPSLVDVGKKLTPDAVRQTIVNGKGEMPPFANIKPEELTPLIAFVLDPKGGGAPQLDLRRYTHAGGPPVTDGPVVASGGAPAGKTDPGRSISGMGPYGVMGGAPYPADVQVPDVRYYSAWNVLYKYINPPWSVLTAYDLNTGTIKWQIPIGEDPTAAAQGGKDTGVLEEQRGIIVTSTGLVFLAAGDGKLRAYDDETGKTLWTASLPAGSRAIPAMYELNGRQYLVVNATTPVTTDVPAKGSEKEKKKLPPPPSGGYVVYALP